MRILLKKSPKKVAEKVKTKNMFNRFYVIFSQHFDTSLKVLLFVTKFDRAKLIVFAFSDYNFGKIQIICGVRTSRTSTFRMYGNMYSEEILQRNIALEKPEEIL